MFRYYDHTLNRSVVDIIFEINFSDGSMSTSGSAGPGFDPGGVANFYLKISVKSYSLYCHSVSNLRLFKYVRYIKKGVIMTS